jgi:hypothetical protein
MDGRRAVVTEALQQLVGFFRSFERTFQLHLAAREVVVLNIDKQKRSFHQFLLISIWLFVPDFFRYWNSISFA